MLSIQSIRDSQDPIVVAGLSTGSGLAQDAGGCVQETEQSYESKL